MRVLMTTDPVGGVWTFTQKLTAGLLARGSAVGLDRPIVVTAHSDVLSWARTCRGGRLEQMRWLRRYLNLVQQGLSRAQMVTAPAQWMADSLQQDDGVPAQPRVMAMRRAREFSAERMVERYEQCFCHSIAQDRRKAELCTAG